MKARHHLPLLLFLLPLGCDGDDDDDDGGGAGVVVQNTAGTVAPMSPFFVRAPWLVYLADEQLVGFDINGDGDMADQVAVAVAMSTGMETPLNVATVEVAIVGDQVYLVVDEADDGMDWDGSGMTDDLVLLHWSESLGGPTFVDTIDDGAVIAFLAFGDDFLLYDSASPPLGPDGTSLRRIEPGDPLMPLEVPGPMGAGFADLEILGEEDDLAFLSLDETETGLDLNTDGDAMDEHVLALLDTSDPTAEPEPVALALEGPDTPFAAAREGVDDWLVAFLVDEQAQGVNLNDPGLFANPLVPDSCALSPDGDLDDQVLHFLRLRELQMGVEAVNTGLAGSDRVLIVDGHVATLSPESDAGCDLNEDGDTDDPVLRWVAAVEPIAPPRAPSLMRAIATDTAGPAMGVAALSGRLVAVVDEEADSREIDMFADDHDLVGWIDPAAGGSADWVFEHQAPNPDVGTGIFQDVDGDGFGDPGQGASVPYAGASWMGLAENGRLPLTFLEEVPGSDPMVGSINTNARCELMAKDMDVDDALPVWAEFMGSVLDFDGVGIAVPPSAPGLTIGDDRVFFFADESADSFDWNEDGDTGDLVLLRNQPLTDCGLTVLGAVNAGGEETLVVDRGAGLAFVSDEAASGVDFNEDGDTNDLVVRYVLF